MRAAEIHQAWRALPKGTLNDVAGTGRVLILAPHPDDESLGCGGLIAALCAAGRPPWVVILTDGSGSHPNSRSVPPLKMRAVRAQEARDAAALLGLPADFLVFLALPDGAAPHTGAQFDEVVAQLCAMVRAGDTICTTWEHEPHCDHLAAWRIARAAARMRGARLVAYPVWGWMLPAHAELPGEEAARPGRRLDVRAWLPQKRAASEAHRSQFGQVVTDDADGFVLPDALLDVLLSPDEVYLWGDV